MDPPRLLKIDDLTRPDHYYLDRADECYYWGEYYAGKGYNYSDTNNLVLNFKKSPLRKGFPEWKYKEEAIIKIAVVFREIFSEGVLDSFTIIPVPPSKDKSNSEYDDRMLQLLRRIGDGRSSDIRELIEQTCSMQAAHHSEDRPHPGDLKSIYRINENLLFPSPKCIVIFDDILTTGCHFKAMKDILLVQFPEIKIYGVFIARVIHNVACDFGF